MKRGLTITSISRPTALLMIVKYSLESQSASQKLVRQHSHSYMMKLSFLVHQINVPIGSRFLFGLRIETIASNSPQFGFSLFSCKLILAHQVSNIGSNWMEVSYRCWIQDILIKVLWHPYNNSATRGSEQSEAFFMVLGVPSVSSIITRDILTIKFWYLVCCARLEHSSRSYSDQSIFASVQKKEDD